MLLEDETGTINLIVPPDVYERDRTVVRAEPLVVAEGDPGAPRLRRRRDQRRVPSASPASTRAAHLQASPPPTSASTTSPSVTGGTQRAAGRVRSRTSRCSTRSSSPARTPAAPPRPTTTSPRPAPTTSAPSPPPPRASPRDGADDVAAPSRARRRRRCRASGERRRAGASSPARRALEHGPAAGDRGPSLRSGLALGPGSPDRVPLVIGTLVFVLIFLAIGLSVVLAAMRSGRPPGGNGPESRGAATRVGRSASRVVIARARRRPPGAGAHHQRRQTTRRDGAGGAHLNAARRPTAARSSRTTARPATPSPARHAVGRVGPNLDTLNGGNLKPAFVLDAIAQGPRPGQRPDAGGPALRRRRQGRRRLRRHASPAAKPPRASPQRGASARRASHAAPAARRDRRAAARPARRRCGAAASVRRARTLSRGNSHDLGKSSAGRFRDVKEAFPGRCGVIPSDATPDYAVSWRLP